MKIEKEATIVQYKFIFLIKGTLAVTPGDQSDNTEAAVDDNILTEVVDWNEVDDVEHTYDEVLKRWKRSAESVSQKRLKLPEQFR